MLPFVAPCCMVGSFPEPYERRTFPPPAYAWTRHTPHYWEYSRQLMWQYTYGLYLLLPHARNFQLSGIHSWHKKELLGSPLNCSSRFFSLFSIFSPCPPSIGKRCKTASVLFSVHPLKQQTPRLQAVLQSSALQEHLLRQEIKPTILSGKKNINALDITGCTDFAGPKRLKESLKTTQDFL